MFQCIVSEANFYAAYRKTQTASPKFKAAAICFAANETENLERLRREVASGDYTPEDYEEFVVFEPKERVIYAPRYRDKIVQHAINEVLRDFYEPKFIFDSYACIRNKGNHKAVKQVQRYMRKASRHYAEPWIIKADVQKFFYSINHDVVKGIIRKKINCTKTVALLDKIIDSSPNDVGLPLGNLTSQLLANVLMNEIDQHIKRRLGVRYYVRYADDLIMIVDGKANAGDVLAAIRAFGRDVIRLTFPDRKCFIRPLRPQQGLEALGYRITPARITLTSKAKSRIIKRLGAFDRLLHAFRLTPAEALQSLNSWYSYAQLAECERFIAHACQRTRYIDFINQRFHVRPLCYATI